MFLYKKVSNFKNQAFISKAKVHNYVFSTLRFSIRVAQRQQSNCDI